MTRFVFAGITSAGERVSGQIKSPDRYRAIETLLGRGIHPVDVDSEIGEAMGAMTIVRSFRNRVSVSDLAVFTRQFAALIKAGMPVVQALSTIKGQTNSTGLKRVAGEVGDLLSREGATLTLALRDYPRVFDPLYTSLVHAGEESGNLAQSLRNLADYLSQASRLRRHVIGAFIYPAFLLILGLTAVFVLMVAVIPRFQELFDSFGQDLPAATQALIAGSAFLSQWWPAVLVGLAGLIGGVVMAMRAHAIRLRLDRLVLRCPVVGPLMLKIEMARMARTLGEMLAGGVSILHALKVTGQVAKNRALRGSFGPMIKAVSTGESVAFAMNRSGLYPPMVLSLVKTGESTGQLPEMLGELSSIYEEEAERAVAAAVKLLEPILIVVMGGVIACIVAAIMLPIFQANSMVQ